MNIIVLIYVLFIKDLSFFVGFHLITEIMIYFLQQRVIFGRNLSVFHMEVDYVWDITWYTLIF